VTRPVSWCPCLAWILNISTKPALARALASLLRPTRCPRGRRISRREQGEECGWLTTASLGAMVDALNRKRTTNGCSAKKNLEAEILKDAVELARSNKWISRLLLPSKK
jgi:hypothetical protein